MKKEEGFLCSVKHADEKFQTPQNSVHNAEVKQSHHKILLKNKLPKHLTEQKKTTPKKQLLQTKQKKFRNFYKSDFLFWQASAA